MSCDLSDVQYIRIRADTLMANRTALKSGEQHIAESHLIESQTFYIEISQYISLLQGINLHTTSYNMCV